MYPSVELFGREIPTYGLMAAAGIICGLLFVFIYARKLKLDAENAAYIYTGTAVQHSGEISSRHDRVSSLPDLQQLAAVSC